MSRYRTEVQVHSLLLNVCRSNCRKVVVVFVSQDNKQNILPAAWWQPVHPALPRGTVEEWRPREDQLRTGRRLKRSVCFPGRLQLITV